MPDDQARQIDVTEQGTYFLFDADKNGANVFVLAHELQRRTDGNLGTVIPAHAVDSDSDCHPIKAKEKAGRPATGFNLPDS